MVITAPSPIGCETTSSSGTFPPGERLIELQLTERYGVGRAAIRAALVELDAEGLVQREANRGAAVRRISVAEAIEITQARAVLEGLIARLAAERASERRAGRRCATLVAEMTAGRQDGRQARLLEAQPRRSTARCAGSPATGWPTTSWPTCATGPPTTSSAWRSCPAGPAESLDQHRAIVAAVTRRRRAGRRGGDARAPGVGHRRAAALGGVRRPRRECAGPAMAYPGTEGRSDRPSTAAAGGRPSARSSSARRPARPEARPRPPSRAAGAPRGGAVPVTSRRRSVLVGRRELADEVVPTSRPPGRRRRRPASTR